MPKAVFGRIGTRGNVSAKQEDRVAVERSITRCVSLCEADYGVSAKLVHCFGSKTLIGLGWMQIRRASGVGDMIR